MQVLVTGANGFIGAHLVRELVAREHQVRGLVRPTSDLRGLAGVPRDRLELAYGDIRDSEAVRRAAQGCEVIFHTAAVYSYSERAADEMTDIAVRGGINVVDAAEEAGARRLVLTSSSVVYGSSLRTVPLDESQREESDSLPHYYRTKAEQERAVFERGAERNIEVVAGAPTVTIGPLDYRLTPSNAAIVNYLNDPFKSTFPGGCNVVHVQDVVRGLLLLAERGTPGEGYVLGSENIEWALFHRIVAELTGVRPPAVHWGHTASLLIGVGMDMFSRFSGQTPAASRSQSKTVGRFYWYRHDKAATLGYRPRPAREAFAHTLAWLVRSPHISKRVRRRLRLSREVQMAWWKPPFDIPFAVDVPRSQETTEGSAP